MGVSLAQTHEVPREELWRLNVKKMGVERHGVPRDELVRNISYRCITLGDK